jgi:hypothetical protein
MMKLADSLHTVCTIVFAAAITSCAGQVSSGVPKSNDATLAGLSVSRVALAPDFDGDTMNYTASVAHSVDTVRVTPTAVDGEATITVQGARVPSGAPSTPVALEIGDTTIDIVVTSPDSTKKKTYSVAVTRLATLSANADLATLVLSPGTLSSHFDPSVASYTASEANDVRSITVTATTADSDATLTIQGVTKVSGTPSAPLALGIGENAITVVVRAANGTTQKAYTLTVTRLAAVSANADLAALALSAGTLSPAFDASVRAYTAEVANEVGAITVTATTADRGAALTVRGAPSLSGATSAVIPLAVGTNNVAMVVTAPDGTTQKAFTLTVTRLGGASANADLTALVLSSGTLSPGFDASLSSYATDEAAAVSSISVTATASDSGATLTVQGTVSLSGVPSAPIPLGVGANVVRVGVRAANGTTQKTYTVTVTRPAGASANADLTALVLSSGALSPGFDPAATAYTAGAAHTAVAITVTATTADAGATLAVQGVATVAGTPSQPISLVAGDNPVTLVVTAPDGATKKTYTVIVTRQHDVEMEAEVEGLITGTRYYLDAVAGDDSADGTSEHPWKTLGKAQSVAAAGDGVILRSGDYGDFSEDRAKRTGYVVYRRENAATPVFSAIRLRGSAPFDANLTFYGIKVAPNPVAQDAGVDPQDPNSTQSTYQKTADAVSLFNASNARFYACELAGQSKYLTSYGISIAGGSQILVKGCHIHDVRRGASNSSAHFVEYIGNHVHRIAESAFSSSSDCSDILVAMNHAHDGNYEFTDDYCPRAAGENYQGSGVVIRHSGIVVRNNVFHDGFNSAGIITYNAAGLETSDVIIENNLVYDLRSAYVLRLYRIKANILVRNNLFVGHHDASGANYYDAGVALHSLITGSTGAALTFDNNVVVGITNFGGHWSDVQLHDNIFYACQDDASAFLSATQVGGSSMVASIAETSSLFESGFFNGVMRFDWDESDPTNPRGHHQTLDFTLSPSSPAKDFGATALQPADALGEIGPDGFLIANPLARPPNSHNAGPY